MDEEYYSNAGEWDAQDGSMVIYWNPTADNKIMQL